MKTWIICGCLFWMTGAMGQVADTRFVNYEQNIPGTDFRFPMVAIPAGDFRMGSPESEKGRDKDEGPQKPTHISPFWMGAYEVSYQEYNAFFQDESFTQNSDADAITRPSAPYIDFTLGMGKDAGFPANSVQQYGAIMYCRWLYKKTGIFFRLPTEAEWEYACRAGTETAYPFGEDVSQLGEYAWFAGNSGGHYHKSGERKPNDWGLYDMLGNVAEWTLDQYQEHYFDSLGTAPSDPVMTLRRRHPNTVRGGSYQDPADSLRSASRIPTNATWNRRDPQIPKSKWWNADAPFVGFRIVRPLKQPTAEEAAQFFKLYLNK